MGSSGSTPSPSRSERGPIPLFLRFAGEDHRRYCTGRRLVSLGLASASEQARPAGAYPLLLDPWAATPLSPADRPRAMRGGVLAVDCSWNRIGARGGLPPGLSGLGHQPHRRRLPFLRATNPQHYGRLGELNTAEALAASLYLLGEAAGAESLLAGFAGGAAFWELNGPALEAYGRCRDPEAVLSTERALLARE
jgi:pre-rRNA-processing protein TSR3